MFRVLVVLYLLIGSLVFAQGGSQTYLRKLDSLQKQLALMQKTSNDTGIVVALNRLTEQIWRRQPDSARNLARKALVLAESIQFKQGMGDAYTNLAYTYQLEGRLRESLEMYEPALKLNIETGNKRQLAWVYHGMGNVYNLQGLMEQALEYHFKAAAIREEIKSRQDLAWSYNNIGYVYQLQDKLDDALEYKRKAIELFEALNYAEGLGQVYGYMAEILKRQGKLTEALEASKKSLQIFERGKIWFLSGTSLLISGLLNGNKST